MITVGVFNHCQADNARSEFRGHLLCESFDLLRTIRLLQLTQIFDQLVGQRGIAAP